MSYGHFEHMSFGAIMYLSAETQAMNTNWILMSSKNPRDEKQTKGQENH